ncbi:MAG: signal recognition particle-docking protein FtsY [Acidimicrobiales bacterium]
MTDPALLTATSDVLIGIVVAVPVVLVAGGIAVASRRRGGNGATDDRTSGGVAVAERGPAAGGAVAPGPAPSGATAPLEVAPGVVEVREPAAEPETVPAPEPATYRGRLGKARGFLSGYIGSVRSRGKIDATTWDELEEALIRADVGVGSTDALVDDLRSRVKAGEIGGPDALVDALKADLVAMLTTDSSGLAPIGAGREPAAEGTAGPSVDVWLFVGVNGVGKTTTVGKVATRLSRSGTRVLLAAGDTFRAAAGEQLSLWAERSGADIVRGAEGGDPSSVVFDAVQRAASKGFPLVLADTAGRLHNKVNLIEELKKIRRVSDRDPGHVTEVLLVLDATTGQNGLAQAKVFLEAVEVSGVVLTKLDGTAKGGIVVAIQRELGLPVKLVGLGEGADDLVDFDPEAFVDALF